LFLPPYRDCRRRVGLSSAAEKGYARDHSSGGVDAGERKRFVVVAEGPPEAIRGCAGNAELQVAIRLEPAADALAPGAVDAALVGVEHRQESFHLPRPAEVLG